MSGAPLLLPLGDQAVLVRFGDRLEDEANLKAIALARELRAEPMAGAIEVVPNLISVLVRYDPRHTHFSAISAELRLRLSLAALHEEPQDAPAITVPTLYGGTHGPDLDEVATLCDLSVEEFIAFHARAELRVLATGFAPGFVYCGLHERLPAIARRKSVRPRVPAGSILFAAGQTAVTATDIPTGWHVIGWTSFVNFDAEAQPPTKLASGDRVTFPEQTE